MENEKQMQFTEPSASLPAQAPPVMRSIVNALVSGDSGVEASDNDHNTDTEHDLFFVKMA